MSRARADRPTSTSGPPAAGLRATYRLQLSPSFGFHEAASVADYLAELGISHVYTSPCLQAASGSTHGYDVVDHRVVSEALGGESGHVELSRSLARHGLGQILDIVPHHMAMGGRDNVWFWDVLENGVESPYAGFFDIYWLHPDGRGKVILPVLADRYGRVLASGELELVRASGELVIRYSERSFPISPQGVVQILGTVAQRASSPRAVTRFVASLRTLGAGDPAPTFGTAEWKAELATFLDDDGDLGAAIDEVIGEYNHDPDRLHGLLEEQSYRLSFWRLAATDVNYRRFCDVNELVALRSERPEVFDRVHARVLGWLSEGVVDGVRVDHVDGLGDPKAYLDRLRASAPSAFTVVEKILTRGESLPDTWPVHGTTGYDFLNLVGGLFVDPRGEPEMTALYRELTGERRRYEDIAYEKKRLTAMTRFGSEVSRLEGLLAAACAGRWRHRDFSREELRKALVELLACFPVYRTYARVEATDDSRLRPDDPRYVALAMREVSARRPDIDRDLLRFLEDILLLRRRGTAEDALIVQLQQVTAAVMAKGIEDTAFYCFNRLVSLNEVGGDPSRFGTTLDEFHEFCRSASERRSQSLLSTSTHDTKRSEDVRARLGLLSEIPRAWGEAVSRWLRRALCHMTDGMPEANAIYLFFQTLVGAHPLDLPRAQAYMLKACREAKTRTSWTDPDPAYEEALSLFVGRVLADRELSSDVAAFVVPLVGPGRTSSLAQKLITLTCPGIPDIYQGTELWDLRLVDPDNRGPVDFGLRRRLLSSLAGLSPEEIVARSDEGLPKLWVVQRTLAFRRRRPELFAPGASYEPLFARGSKREHVVAFVRGGGAITVAPRLVLGVGGRWGDTALELPGGAWADELTGESVGTSPVRLSALLRRFPVALLRSR